MSRYIVTRMQKDPTTPARYQRAGWMAFDTRHERHGQIWPTKAEATADATRLNNAFNAAVLRRLNETVAP